MVERGPEKAGVGGSIPSLATNNFNNLQIAKNIQKSSREQYAYIGLPYKTTRLHSGLGLGLAIVRQLVELHGGTVNAHSDGPGRGATFKLRLPVLSINSVPGSTTAAHDSTLTRARVRDGLSIECPPRLDGVCVLVVDDDSDTRQMLKAVLSECKAHVIIAASAAEAIEEIERRKPDVLISYLGMPEKMATN